MPLDLPNSAYRTLTERFRRADLIHESIAMLGWDSAAMMPTGSAEARSEQVATLEVLAHELMTAPDLGDLLDAAERDGTLDDWSAANLGLMRRSWLHATAVPADLVVALSKASSACEVAWRGARAANDFAGLKPLMEEVLRLVRESGVAKSEAFGCSVYDALLDQYEPGGSSAEIDAVFGELTGFLPGLIDAALEAQAKRPTPLPITGTFPIETQKALGLKLMQALGFDFDRGRLDVSHHPFCGGTSQDVRITTRYSTDDFGRALMGILHETGHALYELGLPADWRYQPIGHARGMSVHESQSLLIEMQACRSRAFADFVAPLAREAFGGSGPAWEPENFNRLNTRVARSLIRVDADEVTYPAHIVLRYRLERALVAGDLTLGELPRAWSDGMAELVGICPPDDRDGCLQDIHWPSGSYGYFPTYTLGAMTAAQLFQSAREAMPDLEGQLSRGDFQPLVAWLRKNVHEKGSRFSAREILIQATGKPLDAQVFRRHLERRYVN